MKTFKINKHLEVKCEVYQTRYSWGHKAYLYRDGEEIGYKKITYYNRTWESYEFESILESLAEDTKALTDKEKKLFVKFIKDGERVKEDCAGLRTIATIAKLGDILGGTKKEQNNWKERMIKAELANKGLIMPDDWGKLSEKERGARLNGAISALK